MIVALVRPFTREGGFDRVDDRFFDGRLADVLEAMNDAMWKYDEGEAGQQAGLFNVSVQWGDEVMRQSP